MLSTFSIRGTPELKKFMAIAKGVMNSENPCPSRAIGTIIVDPETLSVVSTGHNGPPGDLPRCDDRDYLENVVWGQLLPQEKENALRNHLTMSDKENKEKFLDLFADCGQCPRKVIGAPSGIRLELCTCAHSEANAVIKAARDITGMWMFCYCGVPCHDCCKPIIESRLSTVVAIDKHEPGCSYEQKRRADYSYGSRWMLEKAGVQLVMVREGEL
jgi:deoxycytidylate deaminase